MAMKCVMLAAAVGDRRDGHFLGVEPAILAFIDQFAVPDAAGHDRVPHRLVELRRVLPGLEHARILPDGFGGAVAGQSRESLVDPLNRAVPTGDDNGIGCGMKGGPLKPQLLLGALAVGDVAENDLVRRPLAIDV